MNILKLSIKSVGKSFNLKKRLTDELNYKERKTLPQAHVMWCVGLWDGIRFSVFKTRQFITAMFDCWSG